MTILASRLTKDLVRPSRRGQTGVSLIEVMVSLVLGLVVIGAVFATYLSSSNSSKVSTAVTQITEDAGTALSLMRQQIALAGYSRPLMMNNDGTRLLRAYEGVGLMGCDGDFTDDAVSNPGVLACPGNADQTDALVVRYEADTRNTVPSQDDTLVPPAAVPTDCLGARLRLQPGVIPALAGADAYYLADNRFHVEAGALRCRGNGGTEPADAALANAPQPLVENIADMQITYGQARSDGVKPNEVVRYVSASDVGAGAAAWNTVQAVRICLVVQSAEEVLQAPAAYNDCAQEIVTPTDRRLYRAFTTTVAITNRTQR